MTYTAQQIIDLLTALTDTAVAMTFQEEIASNRFQSLEISAIEFTDPLTAEESSVVVTLTKPTT